MMKRKRWYLVLLNPYQINDEERKMKKIIGKNLLNISPQSSNIT